jgi:hypothetical protein
MRMYTHQQRDILGYRQEPVPHTFFRQQAETTRLALVLAGGGNNCQHPTLYYPTLEGCFVPSCYLMAVVDGHHASRSL